MLILASLISVICVVIAAIHLMWAIGMWFPYGDERKLVAAVVGFREATRMPGPIPCSLVTVALLFAAAAPWWGDGMVRQIFLASASLVFLARGGLAFARRWRWLTVQEPFATLDQRYYGPLSAALGLGYVVLLVS